jgi:hypothetical protein
MVASSQITIKELLRYDFAVFHRFAAKDLLVEAINSDIAASTCLHCSKISNLIALYRSGLDC